MAEPHRTPVLQIIHVSDLHVCAGHSDQAKLARDGRMWRLRLRRLIEKRDWFGWHEGTLDHDDTAEATFTAFLSDLRAEDGEWFPDHADRPNPPTWLIDTGDGTTFGDASSMAAVQRRLEAWQQTLEGCEVRWLFGNHDAWPETQPGVLIGAGHDAMAELQRTQVYQWAPWQPHRWRQPLVALTPGGARIECHAISSVSFDWWDNVRGVGRVERSALEDLCDDIRASPPGRSLRILATHHPVAFPYEARDERMWFVQQMVLARSGRIVERLRNDLDDNPALRPLIQLFLAGHTHLGLPGQPLPGTVKEAYQGGLGQLQLQLVSGALMLVRDREAVREGIGPQRPLKHRLDFAQPAVFDANQQFQILRFYELEGRPQGLVLERTVMARVPNDEDGYRAVSELSSETWLPFPG
jgi:hypothetical protein